MSKAIKVGSLVCTNRVIKGQGIVLERVKDINKFLNYNITKAFLVLYDRNHPEFAFKELFADPLKFEQIYALRNEMIEKINRKLKASKPEADIMMLEMFWLHNAEYSFHGSFGKQKIRKPKTDFCKVHWFKPPSLYGYQNLRDKNRSVWLHTRAIKKMSCRP